MKPKELTLERLQEMDETDRSSLIKAIRERLASLPLAPHNRLGFPSRVKGHDVTVPTMTLEATLEEQKRLSRS